MYIVDRAQEKYCVYIVGLTVDTLLGDSKGSFTKEGSSVETPKKVEIRVDNSCRLVVVVRA